MDGEGILATLHFQILKVILSGLSKTKSITLNLCNTLEIGTFFYFSEPSNRRLFSLPLSDIITTKGSLLFSIGPFSFRRPVDLKKLKDSLCIACIIVNAFQVSRCMCNMYHSACVTCITDYV